MKKDIDFINLAIQYAKESVDNGEYPFGAVVVKDGQVVGDSRFNFSKYAGNLNHAEICAIVNACENLKTDTLAGCVLYSSCKPCGLCMGAIKWAEIKEIHYAMDKSDAREIGYADEIFFDDAAPVSEHKITAADLPGYMKDWYDKKVISD
ncbi:MAG: nucleoside deaminase [Rickettsiales bacterium]|jgi:tRNA(Arg) A34 adenosine deaminase TadA|nr:nucleoside deaminase [Rickettsiales bacterium]